jgi:FAD binding domain
VLHEEAVRRGIRIEHGKRLAAVREETGAITALFEDGTAATGGQLVRQPARGPSALRGRSPPDPVRGVAQAAGGGLCRGPDPAVRLISRTNPADLLVVGAMESMPSVPAWHRGRMVLVGDSARAPSSSSGQGASLALESAVELARCLRDHPAAEDAFAAYEAMRRPRAERIAKEAARKNNTKTAGPVGRVLMGAAIRMFARLSDPEKAAWMLHYTIDWDAPAGSS